MKKLRDYTPALIVFILLVLFWQAYAGAGLVDKLVLPAPSDIYSSLLQHRGIIWDHTLQTLLETLTGLMLAVILGAGIGTAIFLFPRFRNTMYPLLVASQTVPIIALAPLLLIWFGFGILPKIIIVVLYCFFPIAVAVSDGLMNTPAHLVDLFKSMKASRWQILRYVRLPSALPSFFSGLRISVTYAVIAAIFGEYVGAYKGLGIFMQTAAHSRAIDLVFASIFVIVSITLILFALVAVLQRLSLPWRYIGEE
ncbi:MAG TPA: ABC transporter permease [Candidatus Saccharimonadales bacterium]|nr:ABC transporter permease [Candidatus Saccharimonadales bacterium]